MPFPHLGPHAMRLVVLWMVPCALLAQVSDKISRVTVGRYQQGQPLSIQAELADVAAIDHIEMAYRPFGQTEYKQVEMALTGNVASASIPPGQLAAPFLEYYLSLYGRGSAMPI